MATLNQATTAYQQANPNIFHKNVVYYNQLDRQWQGSWGLGSFAATGCVPSSLAMVFSTMLGRTVTPSEVGRWLYNNTNQFNKLFKGTSSTGLQQTVGAYGLQAKPLNSQQELTNALQDGHFVVAAVQQNKFSPWYDGSTHEIVLKDFSNGQTYVYDPYHRYTEGWYSVNSLWNEQSTDPIDRQGVVAPFFRISFPNSDAAKTALAVAQHSENEAKHQVIQAQVMVANAKAVPEHTSNAQAMANQTQDTLAKAQQALTKAQNDVEAAKREAEAHQDKLVLLKAAVAEAQEKVTQAQANQTVAQKDLATTRAKLDQAQATLATAKTRLANLQATPAETSQAQVRLAEAQDTLAKDQQALAEVTQALANISETVREKQAVLDRAKADLVAKQGDERVANANLAKAQSDLATLKQILAEAQVNMTKAQAKVVASEQTLKVTQAKVLAYQNAPIALKQANATLADAQAKLAVAKATLEAELAKLDALRATQADTAKHYETVLAAYQAYQVAQAEANRQVKLQSDLATIQAKGGTPVAVVDETGTVVGYVDGKASSTTAKPMVNRSNNKVVTKAAAKVIAKTADKKAYQALLPQTGDSTSVAVVLTGMAMALIGLAGARRKMY